MVVSTENKNIFETEAKHIAFAINKEGYNDAGFAGAVSAKFWPELANCGVHEIGTVLSKTVGDKTFHGLVCHSLYEGWGDSQAETIKNCFNSIPVSDDEPIATIAIGTGFVGQWSGAVFSQILIGMHDSDKNIILNADITLEEVLENCEKNRRRSK